MPYLIVCKKADGSIEVAAHPGDAPPELLQGAEPMASVEEAAEAVKAVLGDAPQSGGETDLPADGDAAPSGSEGMPMESADDQMAAGFNRAKKGY